MNMKNKRQPKITLTMNSIFSSKNMLFMLFLKYLMSFPFVELHILSLQHSFLLALKFFYCIHSSPFLRNTNYLQNWFLFHFFFYIFSLIFFQDSLLCGFCQHAFDMPVLIGHSWSHVLYCLFIAYKWFSAAAT